MIINIKANLLNASTNIICHQVNCKGKMDSGIAKQIKDNYSIVYYKYIEHLKSVGRVKALGNIQPIVIDKHRIIINLYSQYDYGYDKNKIYTNYYAFKLCLKRLREYLLENNIKELSLPKYIGCGYGNADWKIIHDVISEILKDFRVYLYSIET